MKTIIVLVTLLISAMAHCKTCSELSRVESFQKAQVVFYGEARRVQIEKGKNPVLAATFQVLKTYKGKLGSEVLFRQQSEWNMNFPFEEKKRYLVYALVEDKLVAKGEDCLTLHSFEAAQEPKPKAVGAEG